MDMMPQISIIIEPMLSNWVQTSTIMPKKKIKDTLTIGWITIDRDPHASKAAQLRV
jgi:hypothetical protein